MCTVVEHVEHVNAHSDTVVNCSVHLHVCPKHLHATPNEITQASKRQQDDMNPGSLAWVQCSNHYDTSDMAMDIQPGKHLYNKH